MGHDHMFELFGCIGFLLVWLFFVVKLVTWKPRPRCEHEYFGKVTLDWERPVCRNCGWPMARRQ